LEGQPSRKYLKKNPGRLLTALPGFFVSLSKNKLFTGKNLGVATFLLVDSSLTI